MNTLASISGNRKLTDMTEAEAVELITKFSLVKESDLCRVDEDEDESSIFPTYRAKIDDEFEKGTIEVFYWEVSSYDGSADIHSIKIGKGELAVGYINMDILGVIEWFLKKGFHLESEVQS